MNIITSNPIIQGKDYREEDYANLFGEKARRRRDMRQAARRTRKAKRGEDRATKGDLLDRVKGGIDKVKGSGILDTIQGLRGQATGYDDVPVDYSIDDTTNDNTKKGLSTGAKIAIGVGAAIVLGVGAYFLTKKKK